MDVSFLRFIVAFFVNWHSISFFTLAWIYAIVYAVIENKPKWFANESTTYLYHVNTDLVMTMYLTWI